MRSLPRGIYTPLPCFFKDNEDLGELLSMIRCDVWLIELVIRSRVVQETCEMYDTRLDKLTAAGMLS